jgi:hypothetical protein
MCNLTICIKCNKISWTGCGNHLKQLFENKVHREDICECDKEKYKKVYPYTIPPKTN